MRIYLCGHGNHHLEDGFFTLPPNTTVTFYTMPAKLMHQSDTQSIVAGKAMTADRVVEPLRNCPNLTLTCDTLNHMNATRMAWQDNPDRVNTKLFFVNDVIAKAQDEEDETALKLKDLVEAAPGNDFVWSCCYHIPLKRTFLGAKYGMNVNQYVNGGDLYVGKVRNGAPGGVDIDSGYLIQQIRSKLGKTVVQLPRAQALEALRKIDSPSGLPARRG